MEMAHIDIRQLCNEMYEVFVIHGAITDIETAKEFTC